MSITLSALQKQRRDTAANWTAANPTLLAGEIGIESDTNKIKIGTGSTAWTSLAYTPWSQLSAYPIVNADVASNAEIAVSKLADGTARQLLQTDAAGTGVEWASNIDVPGTLDVTGAATFDNNVIIQGDLTVNGTETIFDRVEKFSTTVDKGELVFIFDLILPEPLDLRSTKTQLSLYDPSIYVDIVLGGEKPLVMQGIDAGKCNWSFASGEDIANENGMLTPQVVKLSCG